MKYLIDKIDIYNSNLTFIDYSQENRSSIKCAILVVFKNEFENLFPRTESRFAPKKFGSVLDAKK